MKKINNSMTINEFKESLLNDNIHSITQHNGEVKVIQFLGNDNSYAVVYSSNDNNTAEYLTLAKSSQGFAKLKIVKNTQRMKNIIAQALQLHAK
jgi:hypothetical protein